MARRSVWKSTNTKEVFLNEAREDLSSLNNALVLLEKDPTPGEAVRETAQAAHTLKGMPATMGYEPTARLTHQMETVLGPSLPESYQDKVDVRARTRLSARDGPEQHDGTRWFSRSAIHASAAATKADRRA